MPHIYLGDNPEINAYKVELDAKLHYIQVLRIHMYIQIIDRVSMFNGGIDGKSNSKTFIRELAEKLAIANTDELIEMYDKIVRL